MSDNQNNTEPRQVRYIDPETEPQFRMSSFPPNSSTLIESEQQDRSLLSKTFIILLLLLILALSLIRIEN